MNRLQEYNISTQARSRYSSLAAVLGSKTPRRVPAVLKYLLMISVISLQPIFTLLCFVLFLSESTTLCLSPYPKPRQTLIGSGTLRVYNKYSADAYLHWQLAEVRNGFINELTFIICIMYQIILYILYSAITVDHLHQRPNGFGCGDKHSK